MSQPSNEHYTNHHEQPETELQNVQKPQWQHELWQPYTHSPLYLSALSFHQHLRKPDNQEITKHTTTSHKLNSLSFLPQYKFHSCVWRVKAEGRQRIQLTSISTFSGVYENFRCDNHAFEFFKILNRIQLADDLTSLKILFQY